MDVMYIGGSPCSGKSTLAEMMAEKYGFIYFKLDDHLEPYIAQLAAASHPQSQAALGYSMDEMWMRAPRAMCEDELEIYKAMLPLAQEALSAYPAGAKVIAEGAGFLPEQMKALGVKRERFVCMAPAKAFQLEKYAQRPWINEFLAGCANPDEAFANWMERDALFAREVAAQAERNGYSVIWVDGSQTIAQNLAFVEKLFALE